MSKLYKNTSSRLAAIQLLYSIETSADLDVSEEKFDEALLKKLIRHKDISTSEDFAIDDEKMSKKFVLRLLQVTMSNLNHIDITIEQNLDKIESMKHMNILLISLIRCAVVELQYFDTPPKVVIKEYLKIASTFFKDTEVGFINGLLDKVAKH
ncbi:MAG: transcription antitermination factor NusB [Alphaproteobacteria bacterium]|nr:transcription antitermination factor NusB [Alphaproteobacteria bacterium]